MKLSKKGEHRKRLFVSSAPSRPPAGVYRFGAEMPLALPERGTGNRSPRSPASGSVLGLLASLALSPGHLRTVSRIQRIQGCPFICLAFRVIRSNMAAAPCLHCPRGRSELPFRALLQPGCLQGEIALIKPTGQTPNDAPQEPGELQRKRDTAATQSRFYSMTRDYFYAGTTGDALKAPTFF